MLGIARPTSGCHSVLPAQEELAGSSAHLAAIRRARQSTWHHVSVSEHGIQHLCCWTMSSSHSQYDCRLCSMGHGQPPHMVLPSETTEFAACLCRTHSAIPISAQCVITCINTWSSHKQMLKWLHVAAISRSYLSLHVFLFLSPNPPVRMWPLHICKLPIVPSFCRVHHLGDSITSGSFVFYVGAFPDVSVFDHRTCLCHFSPVFVRLLPLLRFIFHNFRPLCSLVSVKLHL